MIQREKVLEILANIIEPELKKDIVSLNLVEDLRIEENEINGANMKIIKKIYVPNRLVNFVIK